MNSTPIQEVTAAGKPRILTGDRPTGRLHLGHYVGSLQNRVRLQNDYDIIVLLADVQALTTHFEDPGLIRRSIVEVALDNLAVGLDPEKATLAQQSMIPAIAELTVFFSMLVSVNALRHNPTIKAEARQYGYSDLSYGFLGYPVSQAADIAFCGATLVPVGEDQLPHLEQTRKIVRRFNQLYGSGADILPVPKALLGDTPRLCGLDGNAKMGKSLNNAICLSDSAETLEQKLRAAKTDPARLTASDKGHPEICTVFSYAKAFFPDTAEETATCCRQGRMGCAACKKALAGRLNTLLEPVRQRRAEYAARPGQVAEAIAAGTAQANRLGEETLRRVKAAMALYLGTV